jgi:hypothetical protein
MIGRQRAHWAPSAEEERVMTKGLGQFAPLTGVLAVVLWVVAIAVGESGDKPADNAPGADIAAWMQQDSTTILLAATFLGIGSAAFIWFLGSVSEHFRRDGEGRLATVVMATGTSTIVTWTLFIAPAAAGALAHENLDRTLSPQAAETLFVMQDGFFVAAEFLAVGFMGAAAVALIRGKGSPSWFGWITALLAVVLMVGPIGWAGLIFGIPLWTLGVSIWLFVSGRRGAEATTA